MWILKLVRSFALLAVLALAAHAAAGADNHLNGYCGGPCYLKRFCPTQCVCVNIGQGSSAFCLPKPL